MRDDELVGVGELRGLDDLLARGAFAAVGDVVADRSAEEHGFLQHVSDLAAQPLQLVVANVDAVDLHLAGGRIVETRNQADDGRLAAAGRTDDADQLARLDGES